MTRTGNTPEMPGRVAVLPVNKAGYPVPWFAAWIGGQPEFRVIRSGGIQTALAQRLCWVCGMRFLRQEDRAFVIGPMCAVNRVSAEPPCHRDCAIYSATHCPFLTTPAMTRRDRGLPEDRADPAGTMIRRNPGIALVWVTGYKSWTPFKADGGTLFDIGDPKEALWFAHGRPATRAEVLASVESGMPILTAPAVAQGPAAVAELEVMRERAMAWIPAADPWPDRGAAELAP